MSLYPEFARPEVGFKAEENQGLLDYFKAANRAPLDPKGQRAPTVQERINSSLKDFERLIKRPPTIEEQRRIEEIQMKCSGWLEGLKIDLEGETHVPLEYFNRLVAEHEQMIEFVARDRINFDAIYFEKCKISDDKIMRLERELGVNDNQLEIADDTQAPLARSIEAAGENDRLKAQLEELEAKNQWFKDEIGALSQALYPSNVDAKIDCNRAESIRVDSIDDSHLLIAKLKEQLREGAKSYERMKLENSQLKEDSNNFGASQARSKDESLNNSMKGQIGDTDTQISQLQNRIEQLESDKASIEAEYKLRKADLLEKYHGIEREYNQKITEVEEANNTNNALQKALAEAEEKLAAEVETRANDYNAGIHKLKHSSKNTNYAFDEQPREFADKDNNWSRKLYEEYLPKKTATEAEFLARTADFEKAVRQGTDDPCKETAKTHTYITKSRPRKEQFKEELKQTDDNLATLEKQLQKCRQDNLTANAEVQKLNDILGYSQNQKQSVKKDREVTQITVKLKEVIIILLTTVKDLIECVDRGYKIHTKSLLALVINISEKFFAGEEINDALVTLKVFRYLNHRDVLTTSPRTPHRESPCLSCEGYAKDQMDILIELQDSISESISRVERTLA